jgi:hypothetical protein
MSNYTNCVKSDNGKVYCYDKDLQCWVSLEITPLKDTSMLPKDVVEAYLMKAVEGCVNGA